MKEYTDAPQGVHLIEKIATPFEDGYIPAVARLNLKRFLSETSLPFANDGASPRCRELRVLAFWEKSDKQEKKSKPKEAKVLTESQLRAKEVKDFLNRNQTVQHDVVLQVGVQDIKVSSKLTGGRSQVGGGIRKSITEFSSKSRSALESNIRNLPDGSIQYFLTLTMPFFEVGRYLKGDSAKYLMKKIRQWLQYHGVTAGIWFMEFQDKFGNVHFHCYLNKSPVGGLQAVATQWCKMVSALAPTVELQELAYAKMLPVHLGQARFSRPCLEPMRVPHAASYYASKYCVKSDQKKPPSWFGTPGRFWGAWGEMKPSWNTIYLRGAEAAYKAFAMLQEFARIKGFSPMASIRDPETETELPRAFFTRTMRGAVADIDDWLSMVGLDDIFQPCPF